MFVYCSNKTDLRKDTSRIAETSNVSQNEIKYSVLFGTSQSNSIFPLSIATRRPSIWQQKDLLSSQPDSDLLPTLVIVPLPPLSQYKQLRRHKGAVRPFVLCTVFRELLLSCQQNLPKHLAYTILHPGNNFLRKGEGVCMEQFALYRGDGSYPGRSC